MKVGEYVRTDTGRITKIKNIIDYGKENEFQYLNYNDVCVLTTEIDCFKDVAGCRGRIVKSSPNIIDLIEVGDYVNGEQVSRIKQCPEYHLGDGILIFNEHNETIYSNFRTSKYYDITSIVTKEQFSQMEYRIGE